MLKLVLSASLTFAFVSTVLAQTPTERIKIDVTRAELQAIGQGIMKLPYETAAPLLVELQNQLAAQTPKAEAPSGGGAGGFSAPNGKSDDKPATPVKK
jgi:hypothetical protein